MEIPQLKYCCCGCSLHTGSKIIGWLNLIFYILVLIIMVFGLASVFYAETIPDDEATKMIKEIKENATEHKVTFTTLIVYSILKLVFSSFLLLGAYLNEATILLIWVVFSLTTALLVLFIGNAGAMFKTNGAADVLLNIANFILEIYFILVVYSFYRELKNVSASPAI